MDEAAVRRFGVEPDFENYTYTESNCSWCGHPVLTIQSKERAPGYRSEFVGCPTCMTKLSRRTRAKEFDWVFLANWKPEQ